MFSGPGTTELVLLVLFLLILPGGVFLIYKFLIGSAGHKRCPYCAEYIEPGAKTCPSCKRNLPDKNQ
jgi:hypothetical protein